jgi:site-specific recombinase XerD
LLLLLYGAGLRISEALQLKETDVDLEERLLSVRQSKFFKSRLVPIGPKLAQALKQTTPASVPGLGTPAGRSSGRTKGHP